MEACAPPPARPCSGSHMARMPRTARAVTQAVDVASSMSWWRGPPHAHDLAGQLPQATGTRTPRSRALPSPSRWLRAKSRGLGPADSPPESRRASGALLKSRVARGVLGLLSSSGMLYSAPWPGQQGLQGCRLAWLGLGSVQVGV